MSVKENVTTFGAAAGIFMSMLNVPTYFTVPNHTPQAPVKTAEQPISASTTAAISFDRPHIASTPAPVASVAEPQSDATTSTTPESTPTASPVVVPAQAPAAKKTTTTTPAPVAAPVPTAAPALPVPAAPVPVAAVSGLGSRIASAALAQLGVAQDCTMLVTNSLAAVGIHFHGWPADYISLGRIVPASQAQVGDLVYYQNGGMGLAHIAVYIGNGQAVHGGWNGETTAIASVNIGSGPVFIRVGG